MEPKLCAVVPSRNHYAALGAISATLRAHGLNVFIVDDASAEPARTLIAKLHAPAQGVEVIRLAENQGKGGAVAAGLRYALDHNFTHAVQVDADGQHDLRGLPALIDAALAQPGALTEIERFQFDTFGYLVIPDALTPDETAACLEASKRARR